MTVNYKDKKYKLIEDEIEILNFLDDYTAYFHLNTKAKLDNVLIQVLINPTYFKANIDHYIGLYNSYVHFSSQDLFERLTEEEIDVSTTKSDNTQELYGWDIDHIIDVLQNLKDDEGYQYIDVYDYYPVRAAELSEPQKRHLRNAFNKIVQYHLENDEDNKKKKLNNLKAKQKEIELEIKKLESL